MSRKITVALAGNPNAGKSTVFNNLTGSHQHVGNYPGVTVEKKEGTVLYKDYTINVVDLPGIYSLTARSMDEIVARNFVVDQKPDVVIDIIDTSNLERNLYLATQFIEMGVPLILAFNMYDIAQRQGMKIDKNTLSQLLGAPIVFTVAIKNQGMQELLAEVVNLVEGKTVITKTTIDYGREIEKELSQIVDILRKEPELSAKYSSRWLAVKLLESDSEVIKTIKKTAYAPELERLVGGDTRHLEEIFADEPEAIFADMRYGFISGACSEAVHRNYETRHSVSDKIDMFLLNRVAGLPIFLFLIWLMFKFTFTLSEPLVGFIEAGQKLLGNVFTSFLPDGSMIQSLVVDGIIGGVGSVLVFVPIIFSLFFAMAFLEDTGYMARAAFIMDKFMHKIGLHGRSFIPLLLGFGCSVPAVMATRSIEDRRDRLVTMLVVPFSSCGARLPVYILFIGAFFPARLAGNVIFSLYILGILIAVIIAKVLRKYMFKGEAAPFVMELPPYRMPIVKALLYHIWERGVMYLKKAGTIILGGSVIIWFLSNFPWNPSYAKDYDALIQQAHGNVEVITQVENEKAQEKMGKSYASYIGKAVVPVFRPLGLDDWRLGVGIIQGFIAKEIVVSTLGTLYAVGETDEKSEPLRYALQSAEHEDGSRVYSPLTAYALMVFVLLYVPCIACIAVIKQESNTWKWPIFTAVYTTTVAWIAAFLVYQGGIILGFG